MNHGVASLVNLKFASESTHEPSSFFANTYNRLLIHEGDALNSPGKYFGRSWLPPSVSKLNRRQISVLIFAIALLVRLAIIVHFHPYRNLERFELERTAISLATTGVYGNPYAVETGPTGHVAPGYTLILAALFRLLGTGIPAEIVKELVACVVSSLLWALLPAVSAVLRLDLRAGVIAGLFGAVFPLRPLIQIDGNWETPYIALSLVLVTVLMAQLWTKRNFTVRRAWLNGFCWGVSLLFAPSLLLLLGGSIAVGFYFSRSQTRNYIRFAAIQVLAVAACLSPWVIRNYYALGSPVLTRTNLGIELRLSNNDLSSPDMDVNYWRGLFRRYHPLQNPQEALKVRRMGEVAYNKQAKNEAKQWIRSHPSRFLQLCLGRFRCFWFYSDRLSKLKTVSLGLINVMGFAGWVLVWRQRRIAGLVLALIILIYPIPYYIVQVTLRYSYPIMWVMVLLSASLVLHVIERATHRAVRDRTLAY